MHEFDTHLFRAGLVHLGLTPTDLILDRFHRYHEALLDWNQRINLISRSDESRIVTRHFLDSLLPLAVIQEVFYGKNIRMMDLGSGAGFPGIPLGIIRSDLRIFLVEARKKKCRFLSHIVALLGLDNVSIVPERAEAWCKSLEKPMDLVISRAVTSVPKVIRYGIGALRKGGRFVFLVGAGSLDLKALSRDLKSMPVAVDNIVEVLSSPYHRDGIIILLSRGV